MAKVDVINLQATKVGEIDLDDTVFGAEVKEHLFWEAVKAQQASQRQGTKANKGRSQVSGPIPLPTKRQMWTVLRSPHIDKKSREQFELKTHKRLIDILDSRSQTVDALTKLDLPAGVDVEIKVE